MTSIRFGVSTFGDVPHRPGEERMSDAATIREIVDQAVLAERLGIDSFTVGQHHREDMPVPSPEMVLAAIAPLTEKLLLGSAVTVLSTDDPVRVYERFATLDALSEGRAEPILGRGSFTESFPLYGFDLAQYDALFEEKLGLWGELRAERPVTWEGRLRPSLTDQSVYPRTEHAEGLPTWVGVGGNPQSVVRVAQYGFDLMLAGLGMTNERLAQYAQLFTRAAEQLQVPRGRIGLSANGYVADTDEQARDEMWPQYRARMSRIGRDRGWAPVRREDFEAAIDHGVTLIGSPETVTRKIVDTVTIVGLDRLDVGYDTVSLPLANKTRSLTLLGSEVFPAARAEIDRIRA